MGNPLLSQVASRGDPSIHDKAKHKYKDVDKYKDVYKDTDKHTSTKHTRGRPLVPIPRPRPRACMATPCHRLARGVCTPSIGQRALRFATLTLTLPVPVLIPAIPLQVIVPAEIRRIRRELLCPRSSCNLAWD
jgi:hypothetical protein